MVPPLGVPPMTLFFIQGGAEVDIHYWDFRQMYNFRLILTRSSQNRAKIPSSLDSKFERPTLIGSWDMVIWIWQCRKLNRIIASKRFETRVSHFLSHSNISQSKTVWSYELILRNCDYGCLLASSWEFRWPIMADVQSAELVAMMVKIHFCRFCEI